MKKSSYIFIILLSLTTLGYAQKIPADTIFANYYKATGGEKLWDSIKTYSMEQSFNAVNATPYESEVFVSIPESSIYRSKTILKRSFIYTVKDKEGWIKVPIGGKMNVKDLSVAEQTTMRYEIYDQLAPFINYKERGLIATTVGQELVNKVQTNQVELQGKDIKYNLWFDAKTGMLVRKKESAAGVETTTELSDYIKSSYGILYPSKMIEINSIDKKPVTITSKLEVNKPLETELFVR